jgi:hypothetical protein
VSILTFGSIASVLLIAMQTGDTIRTSYESLVSLTLIGGFLPFVYIFLSAWKAGKRLSVVSGLAVTVLAILAALSPTNQVTNVWLFEAKLVIGTVAVVASGRLVYFLAGNQTECFLQYFLDFSNLPEIYHPNTGISTFQCGTPSAITYAAQYESFRYIERLGIPDIQAHARPIITRLRKELPALGFSTITPAGADTPIITFLCRDIENTKARFREAWRNGSARVSITGENPALTIGRFGNQMRFSVSVFNNQDDVSRVLDVLS